MLDIAGLLLHSLCHLGAGGGDGRNSIVDEAMPYSRGGRHHALFREGIIDSIVAPLITIPRHKSTDFNRQFSQGIPFGVLTKAFGFEWLFLRRSDDCTLVAGLAMHSFSRLE